MPTRKATAEWKGGFKRGSGTFRAESGRFSGDYTTGTRFGDDAGTNPEELLAAAQASCFSQALALALEQDGTPAELIRTEARCTIEKQGDGYAITRMALHVRARVPGADEDRFVELAEQMKVGCPVSKALRNNVQLELDAALEQAAPTG